MEAAQLKAQEHKPEDSKALAELLNKQKVGQHRSYSQQKNIYIDTQCIQMCVFQILVAEIEKKQSSIDECQKYSEQYSSAVKVKPFVVFNLV